MYIAKEIPFDDCIFDKLNLSNKDIEVQCVLLNIPNLRQIVVSNIYRPPQGSIKNFSDALVQLSDQLRLICKDNVELYFMGDFNLDFLRH